MLLCCAASVLQRDPYRSECYYNIKHLPYLVADFSGFINTGRGHSNNPIEVLPCSAAFACKDVPSSDLPFKEWVLFISGTSQL